MQTLLRQREGELAAQRERMASLEQTRLNLAEELVAATSKVRPSDVNTLYSLVLPSSSPPPAR
eukprot:230048-Prorocentrum_minimum.AAC.1